MQDSCLRPWGSGMKGHSEQHRILVTYPLPEQALEPLAECGEVIVLERDQSLRDAVQGHDGITGIVCLLTDPVDSALLDTLPALAWVSSVSVGVDHVDVARLSARGIPLGYTPGVLVDATADTAFALLLAAARRVAEGDRFVRDRRWLPDGSWNPDFFLGKDVSGATLGILGLGAIGQAVARRAAAFGMRVLGWTPSGRSVEGVEPASFEQVLSDSDFVSVHVALSEATRNLVGSDALALMKHDAVLVNTARGGIVDEQALYDALRSGRLLAAGLDVFATEPLPLDHPLLALGNVVFTPHIGSATARTRANMVRVAVENAVAAMRDARMPHCFNPSVYGG